MSQRPAATGFGSRRNDEDEDHSVADQEDVDSTQESGQSAADPSGVEPSGAHAIEPAVSGVPAEAAELTFRDRERLAADGVEDGDDSQGDKELVTVGAGAKEREVAPRRAAGKAAVGRTRKSKATSHRKQGSIKDRRTGPVTFIKESAAELQKVVYPTGQQLVNYFIVVLVFVLFIIGIVSLLDLAFGAAILKIFS